MSPFFKNCITLIKKCLITRNKRKIHRVDCDIKAHYFLGDEEALQRGSATISDIHKEGLCCSHMAFYREDLKLKQNMKIKVYFSMTRKDGSAYQFTLIGITRFLRKEYNAKTYKAGLSLAALPKADRKIFNECISALIEKQEKLSP
jgi:hypothetical protein